MGLLEKEQKVIDGLFSKLDAKEQIDFAKALIQEASQYLGKEDHLEVVKELIDSIADFPNPSL